MGLVQNMGVSMFALIDVHGTVIRRFRTRNEAIAGLDPLAAKIGRERAADEYAVMEFDEVGRRVGVLIRWRPDA